MKTTEQEILTRLSLAIQKRKEYEPYLKQYFPNKEIRLRECKPFALMVEVTNLWQQYKREELFTQWNFVAADIEKPKFGNVKTFYNLFINKIGVTKNHPRERILENIVEFIKPKPRGRGLSKTPDEIIKLIFAYYSNHSGFNCSKITKDINLLIQIEIREHGVDHVVDKYKIQNTDKQRAKLEAGNYLKVSTVKKYLDLKAKNILYDLRFGKKAGREREMPLPRINALYAMDRVEFDSTVLSFIRSDSNGKATIKLYIAILIDCFSNRIIGFAFGKTESAKLALTAFKNAFNTLECLPAEIYTDRFPGFNNEEIKHFMKQLENLGCKLWFDRTGNPRSKGKVEKSIDTLCEIAKEYPNYIGKNITTKRRDSRKPIEVIAEMSKSKNLESLQYVKGQIVQLIALYNSLNGDGESLSRAAKFKTCTKPNAITLTLEDRVWLFHKVDIKKIENGLIVFRRGQYSDHIFYQINDYNVRLRNGGQVKVRYTDQSLERGEEIYLFDAITDEPLCTCLPKKRPHLAQVNQNENDVQIIKEHIEDKKLYRNFIREKQSGINAYSINILNYLNATKLEVLNAEELYTLQGMDRDLDSELIPFKNEAGEIRVMGKSRKSIDPLNLRPKHTPRFDDDGNTIKPLERLGDEWDKPLPYQEEELERALIRSRLNDEWDKPLPLADESELGCEPV